MKNKISKDFAYEASKNERVLVMIEQVISYGRKYGASDIHFDEGGKVSYRIDGVICMSEETFDTILISEEIKKCLTQTQLENYNNGNDIDFAIQMTDLSRYRVNLFHRLGKLGCVIRLLNNTIPTIQELNMPSLLCDLVMLPRGLVLITGSTGSGKSTTLAAMLEYANENRQSHIITIEDPVEYLYSDKKSIFTQREVGKDVESFEAALRSSMREDPDVILLGEMRDYETISAALTAAETGHLVLSTLHTSGAAKSVDRIIDAFPPHQQAQVRVQLAGVLRGIVTQQLVRQIGGGRVAAIEIMVATQGILNMIREAKTHQITSAMQTGGKDGMVLMDSSLAQLVKSGKITVQEALKSCINESDFNGFMNSKN